MAKESTAAKELLTKESILLDIRHSQKYYTSKMNVQADNFIIWGSMFITVFIFAVSKSPYAFLLLLVPIGYFLIRWFLKRRKRTLLDENDFTVDTDKLVSVQERVVDVGGKYGRFQTMLILNFNGGGEWEVPYRNYPRSKNWKMSRKGIENTSLQGDIFYIVRLNETGRIAVAYNTKFFDYPIL